MSSQQKMDIEEPTIFNREIDELLNKEKLARQNNDHTKALELLPKIVQIAFDAGEWDQLNQLIKLLAKKRGQVKKALIEMIQLSMKWIDKTPNLQTKLALIETIKEVTEKKIFLEVEYARCVLMLVKHKEGTDIAEAAKILQEVQVETYGSMDRREKIEFILYQMNIMIKKRDYVRLLIISRKINQKNISDKGLEDLKIQFYSYLAFYYTHENKYVENAQCFKTIYDTLKGNEEVKSKLPEQQEFDFSINMDNLLSNFVLYTAIASHSLEQSNLLNDINTNYKHELERSPKLQKVVESLLSTELINTNPSFYDLSSLEIFSSRTENNEKHQRDFTKQLIQHNLRMVEKYYTKIALKRLSELLSVTEEVIENELCEMINNKLIIAKINRLDGIIEFKAKKSENEILNDWRSDIHKILDLVDHTCNFINRENELLAVNQGK